MKDALRDLLVSYVGDDMVKVIVGPEGSGIDAFLFGELRDSLKKKYPKARMVDARGLSSEGIKENCPKEGGGQRTFIFASNLWGYPDFDVIVNLCARKNGVDLFASALTPFPTAFPEKHTLIRGRVERFWFPSTLYEDYLKEHPSATAFAFLTSNDLNLEIVDQNLEALSRSETACLQAALEYGTNPLTVRSLAKSVSKNTKAEFSCYKASAALRKIESLGICYLIDRYDLKQKRVISGKVFFPVDNRYYKILGRGKTREELCMAPVLVGKLLYDRWDVKKQSMNPNATRGRIAATAMLGS